MTQKALSDPEVVAAATALEQFLVPFDGYLGAVNWYGAAAVALEAAEKKRPLIKPIPSHDSE